MNIPETYAYLTRARRDLWPALQAAPDEVLSRSVLNGPRFHCIKDLVLHIPVVEDSWIHEDLLADAPVWESVPAMRGAQDGPVYDSFALDTLLDYWRQVEASTQTYLGRLTPAELVREVVVNGPEGEKRFAVDGLLWHVLIHEMRHTAQIAVLLRQAGIKPQFLDLPNYLSVTQK